MSTLLPTSAPHTFYSCTQICMTLCCPHVCPSLHMHQYIYTTNSPCLLHPFCIAACKHVFPCVSLSACCIPHHPVPTPGLECVPASVHACMSIMVTFKKLKYIKDILVRAKISKGKQGSQPQCNRPKTCQMLYKNQP